MPADGRDGSEHILLRSFGVVLEVEVEDRGLLEAVHGILPPGWEPVRAFPEDGHLVVASEGDGRYGVLVDGSPSVQGVDRTTALLALDHELRTRIAVMAPDVVFVHAGVVAHAGRALVLPGRSFSGKTTLVAALVGAGATYYSDEYAVLDGDGQIHPYARRLSVRSGVERHGEHVPVEAIGGIAGEDPVPLGLVAELRYSPSTGWDVEPMTPGAAALSLIGNTLPARLRPQQVLATISRAVADVPALKGHRGEADEAAQELLARLTMS